VIIFDVDDPLVLNGTYDQEGYKPGERARIAKARARQQQLEREATMAKRASKVDKKLTRPDKRKVRVKEPRQPDLIPDRPIKALENVAVDYAEIRDRRMELTEEEATLKRKALALMHKFGKTEYRHGDVSIKVIDGEEKVRVRIGKPTIDEPDEDEDEGVDSVAIGEPEIPEEQPIDDPPATEA
jgi:hypothetical protein